MKPNPIVWCEIYVQDMDRAKSFYETVFQVTLEKLEGPGVDMWAFPMSMDKAGASGALVKMDGVKSGGSGTIPYFHCDEVAVESDQIPLRIEHQSHESIGIDGHLWLLDLPTSGDDTF